jgi:hypothetical protein
MVPKFCLDDIVFFENKMYSVKYIYIYDRECNYCLSVLGSRPNEPYEGKLVVVREALLQAVTQRDLMIWRLLYG